MKYVLEMPELPAGQVLLPPKAFHLGKLPGKLCYFRNVKQVGHGVEKDENKSRLNENVDHVVYRADVDYYFRKVDQLISRYKEEQVSTG